MIALHAKHITYQHLNNNVVLEVKKEAGVSPVINTNSTNLLGLKK